MCGRYTLRVKLNLLLSQFAAELAYESEYDARYNIAPTQHVPAVRLDEDGRRRLVGLRWGLIPVWAKDAKIAHCTLNARAGPSSWMGCTKSGASWRETLQSASRRSSDASG
jgi:putative SOS response-associated peptidase YedK